MGSHDRGHSFSNTETKINQSLSLIHASLDEFHATNMNQCAHKHCRTLASLHLTTLLDIRPSSEHYYGIGTVCTHPWNSMVGQVVGYDPR